MRLNTTWIIFVCALMLITIGVVMVYSSSAAIAAKESRVKTADQAEEKNDIATILQMSSHSADYLKRQAIFAVLAILGLLITYQIDYERYKRYAAPLLIFTFILLILVYFPVIGVRSKGANRWLNLGIVNLQVSELAKLSMILYMAKKVTDRQAELKSLVRGFLPSLAILLLFLGVIVMEPDLGASVMLAVIVYGMWFVGGMRIIHLASLFVLFIPLVALAIYAYPHRIVRIVTFLDPYDKEMREGHGWQLWQSLMSVATGGLRGIGLGEGPQKYQFLSEGHTDFIFAVICEETGMLGAMAVFTIYGIFMVQGIRVAVKAPDMYGSLLATGITIMIGVQAFVNMYVVVGLLPTKGLTLPLISYGGSSLIINGLAVGILMNVSRYTEMAASQVRKPISARGN